jgi:hypothetical protein
MTHHDSGSGGVTTILPIIFSVLLQCAHTQVVVCPGTPKVESRNYSGFGLPGLWDIIAFRPNLRLGQGLNQTCSPLWELSNAMLHSPSAHWERVDSRLLVVGSQTANLTLDPSFAHNLSCRCPNDQCEAISDIYTSRPFEWHQEHPKARCFAPCCRALNIRESRRTPTPQLWECEFHPHIWPKWGCDCCTYIWFFLQLIINVHTLYGEMWLCCDYHVTIDIFIFSFRQLLILFSSKNKLICSINYICDQN